MLVNGIAYHMHEYCAEKVSNEIQEENIKQKEERTGSYLNGIVGAVLGALVGSVLWALVLSAGYVASIVGFAIGWLAEKGYNLFRGKQGKGKVAILIIAVIIVLAMNLVGSLLISALVVFPALSAMRLFRSFLSVTVCAAVLSVLCAAGGLLVSILFGTPVGSTIVAADLVAFALCALAGRLLRR